MRRDPSLIIYARRLRTVAALITSPLDMWLGIRMFAWSLVLPGLKFVVPLPLLARLMWSRGRSEPRPGQEEKVVVLARGISRVRPLPHRDNCLEKSLLMYRFLSRLNADPRLVTGVRRGEEGVVGHVWVTVAGEPVGESPAELEQYAPVAVFGAGGVREPEVVR